MVGFGEEIPLPLYEWVCLTCGGKKGVLSPDTPHICKCGGKSWKKVPSSVNFKVVGGTEKFYRREENNET